MNIKLKEVDYERLPEVYKGFHGVGIPGLSAELIERTETEAIYYRWDNVWEVFRIKIAPPSEYYGNSYPKREVYPGNEAFGSIAWCLRSKDLAYKKYNAIICHPLSSNAQETDEDNGND